MQSRATALIDDTADKARLPRGNQSPEERALTVSGAAAIANRRTEVESNVTAHLVSRSYPDAADSAARDDKDLIARRVVAIKIERADDGAEVDRHGIDAGDVCNAADASQVNAIEIGVKPCGWRAGQSAIGARLQKARAGRTRQIDRGSSIIDDNRAGRIKDTVDRRRAHIDDRERPCLRCRGKEGEEKTEH